MTPAKKNQSWMPSIFNDFWGNEWLDTLSNRMTSTIPAMNIMETEDGYRVELAAPGLTKDDFQININNDNELIISVDKNFEKDDKDKKGKYLRREFGYTQFRQTLLLPENIDKENIQAKQNDGVLYIELKKKALEQVKNSKPIEVR